ncbi:hypothetical protein ACIA5D_44670 [Actinoplanes sp. NPDC051513]|uniref:hypothetical protein n=1 Tax=Actinoplanes sp. NPDC051513 TaxID=3363908 RepID=UPI0037B925F9
MNPSQESAPSPEPAQSSGPPPVDPTADPGAYGAAPTQPAAGGSHPGNLPISEASPAPVGPEVYGLPADGGGYELAHPTGPAASRASKWWGMGTAPRRPWKRTALVAVLSAAVVFVLGGPLGLLWAWVAPSVPVIATGQNIVVSDPSPEEYIAADGWYTLLGLGFGVLVAAIAWLVLRRDRGPFLLLGVVAGTLGAGFVVARWVGQMIGESAYEQWRETAVRGATYLAPPEVHAVGPRLVPAFAAAIVLTLLAGWSNDPDLDEPGAKPGYGPNAAAAHHGAPPPWPGTAENLEQYDPDSSLADSSGTWASGAGASGAGASGAGASGAGASGAGSLDHTSVNSESSGHAASGAGPSDHAAGRPQTSPEPPRP